VVYGSGWKRAEVLNACGVMGSGPDRDRPQEEVVREVHTSWDLAPSEEVCNESEKDVPHMKGK
jgi:hypothetical protein